jgi:hypothetical protein
MAVDHFMPVKTCGQCCTERALDQFSKNARRPDGLCWNCKRCVKAYKASYYEQNRDALVQKQRDLKAADPERIRATNRLATARWYRSNKAAKAAYVDAWANKNAERLLVAQRARRRSNPHQVSEWKASRRVAEKRRCAWADRGLMRDIYLLAKIHREAGLRCGVDHTVPLKSALVCGLHTHHNLSVLLMVDNSAKGNRVWPDMP